MLIPQILILILMFTVARSMRFDILSGRTRCISEDIRANSMVIGHFTVVNPNGGPTLPDTHKITIRVTSPYGNNYHYGGHVDSGNFAFTASESGDYAACFWVSEHKPGLVVTVEFDWRNGIATKDWSKVAKKGQVEVMEFELKQLSNTISSIHDEMFFLRAREEEMHQLNRATGWKITTLSFLSIIICVSVAGMQFWHLKAFFERKKLI